MIDCGPSEQSYTAMEAGTATLRSVPSLTSDFTGVSRSRQHFTPLMHPPGYPATHRHHPATPPTCSSALPTLIDDDATTYMEVPDSPLGRPSTPFPDMKGEDEHSLPCSIVRSTSRSWPLGPRCGIYLGRDNMSSPTEPKYKSRIPIATTYRSPSRSSYSPSTLPATFSPPPLAVHVLAADSRIASVRSGVEDKEAELQRLHDQISQVNLRLETLSSSGGSRRAKYRSIISRGRPLPSFQDGEDTLTELVSPLDNRRDSGTDFPFHSRVTSSRFSSLRMRQNTLSSASSIAWPEGSETSSQGRHRPRPSETQASTTSGGQETDETFSDSDHVSLKNFPATPRSRRSRIPRRPVSSMMSTSSSFSDMPTVYETRTATPVVFKDAREAGCGVSTVYNHGSTRVAKKVATPIKPIAEQDETAVETTTLASEEHIEQDLGTLGGYLVTPDPTPPASEVSRKFSRQATPMYPAQLRVVNISPRETTTGPDTKAGSGPSPPKFALSPAVRPQHLSETARTQEHPAFRDDPFSSSPPTATQKNYPAQQTQRHSPVSPMSNVRDVQSTEAWPLIEEQEEFALATPAQATSSRRPRVFRKLFQQNTQTDDAEGSHSKAAHSAKRPFRNLLKKITPGRAKAEPVPVVPVDNSAALTLKRAPTARSSAPPRLPRHRDSTLRFEQMLMKEIGSDSPTARLARRASASSTQLLQRSITRTTSSVASTVYPHFSPTPAVRPLREYHMRAPTVSTFRCSMAFV